MKNLFILCALSWGGLLFAQKEEEKSNDTTRVKFGGVEFIIINHDTIPAGEYEDLSAEEREEWTEEEWEQACEPDLTYWSGFDIGVNMLMNGSFEPDFNSSHLQADPAQSMSYSFNIMEQRIRIIGDYFGLVTGIGFTNSRYGFKDDRLRLVANSDSTWGYRDSSLVSGFTKNQLRVNYFNIPLLFQVNTSKDEDRNFHIAFGAVGGVRIGSNVKYVYDVYGGESDHKEKGRFNLSPFQVCATARIGFRDFGLFANYNVLTLFESGKSETAYPLTFGASFHF